MKTCSSATRLMRDQTHGGEAVDATEAAQRTNRLGVGRQLADGLDVLIERA